MDRKSIIILVLSFVLIILWQPLVMRTFYPAPPTPTNAVASATNQVASTNQASAPPASVGPVAPSTFSAPTTAEETLVLTNENAVYVFSSHGGGIKVIELRNYPETIECGREVPGERRLAALNKNAQVPAMAVVGSDALQGDNLYTLTRTEKGVRAEKTLSNNLAIIKDFELGSNYIVKAKVRIENRSQAPISLPPQQIVIGTATPMGIHDNGLAVGLNWFNGSKTQEILEGWFANKTLGCFPGTPRTQYQSEGGNVAWAAVRNQFFTIAAIPSKPAPEIVARRISLPAPAVDSTKHDSRANLHPVGYESAFVYPTIVLNAGASQEHDFTIYAGPKEYKLLSRIGNEFKTDFEGIMGYTGFFGWFARALLEFLNKLHSWGLSYGLAIIAITVIIKLLFWPLTNASTKSMKRMQQLQPKMKEIQDKYKDDPQKMNMKLMEFMRENKVSPLGGCLPMLLQIPVFFGFYRMLQSAIELRGVSFLWACDLSQPDTVAYIAGFALNILPLLWFGSMLWQTSLTPVSPGVDPAQQKIMKYMPMIFFFVLYNMSAGLTLYWTVQNLLTIVQTKLTKTTEPPTASPGKAASPPAKKK